MSKRWPEKIIIGLTGNIATGKSAVMRMAAESGALTLDADKVVHQIMASQEDVRAAIVKQFGPSVQQPDGRINRAALAAVVFRDELALSALEQILHPAVRQVVFEQVAENEANVVMIEAIKLLEGKLAAECDQIWVTRCPKVNQIERLMVCRGMDGETAAMRVNAQAPQEEKVAQADVVIDTDGTMADTRHFFDIAWERVLQMLPDPLRTAAEGVSVSGGAVSSVSVSSVSVSGGSVSGAAVSGGGETLARAVPETGVEGVGEEKAPPERLGGSKAAEIRKRMLAKKQEAEPVESAETTEAAPKIVEKAADAIVVRRARPSDVPSILLLIQRATGGAVKMKRGELLMALGDRGYLIGQQGTEISTVIGWNSENLVARIDQIFVHPPEAATIAGPAVLKEIEDTAVSLICEVILAFPSNQVEPAVLQLFLDTSFEEVDPLRLPEAWKAAVDESQPENTFVMMKVLRDTRSMQPG